MERLSHIRLIRSSGSPWSLGTIWRENLRRFLFIDSPMIRCRSLMCLRIVRIIGCLWALEQSISCSTPSTRHLPGPPIKFKWAYLARSGFLSSWILCATSLWEIWGSRILQREVFQKGGASDKFLALTTFGSRSAGWPSHCRRSAWVLTYFWLCHSSRCSTGPLRSTKDIRKTSQTIPRVEKPWFLSSFE